MHLRRIAILAAFGFSVLAGHGAAQAQVAAPIAVRNTADLGPILTDQAGRTLYLYTEDTAGASTCYDGCAFRRNLF